MSYAAVSTKDSRIIALASTVFVAIVGTIFLVMAKAASPSTSVETEQGSISLPASIISDPTASGGSAVRFNTAVTGTQLCTARDGGGGVPSGYYPAASCTGYPAGTTLTKVPSQATSGTGWVWNGGVVNATGNNVTISGLEISGGVDLTSYSGVTFKNSWVKCTGISDFCLTIGTSSTVVDTEVGDSSSPNAAIGTWSGGPNDIFTRVHIHDTSDGMRIDGGTTTTDSYIHTLSYPSFPGAHSDGSQTTADALPTTPLIFTHNTVQGGNNDGLFFQSGTTVTIQNNYLVFDNRAGENTSFGLGFYNVTGPITIKDNVFDNAFGAATSIYTYSGWPAGTVTTGNHLVNGTVVP